MQKESSREQAIKQCRIAPIRKGAPIGLTLRDGTTCFTNLQTCRSQWACVDCTYRARRKAAGEMEKGLRAHLGRGGTVLTGVFTLAHQPTDSLSGLLDRLQRTYAHLTRSGAWKKDREKFGLAGSVRVLHITHGEAGWHPHLHVLFLAERLLTAEAQEEFEGRLFDRWARQVEKLELRSTSRLEHLELVRDPVRVCHYLTSLWRADGSEASGRLPFQILKDFAEGGDARHQERWQEYERAMKGRQAIRWSNGLKRELGVDEDEAGHEDDGEISGFALSKEEWDSLKFDPAARWKVLNAARHNGLEAADRVLRERMGLQKWEETGREPGPPVSQDTDPIHRPASWSGTDAVSAETPPESPDPCTDWEESEKIVHLNERAAALTQRAA